MIQKFFSQKNTGFTIIETLVAISIFTTSILVLLAVLTQGISNTSYAKKKIIAGYLAQEGIECIRNTRDNYILYAGHTWADFKSISVANIFCPNINPSFVRTLGIIEVIPSNPDEVKIFSKVEWTQGSGNYNITFSENLFNWVQ